MPIYYGDEVEDIVIEEERDGGIFVKKVIIRLKNGEQIKVKEEEHI